MAYKRDFRRRHSGSSLGSAVGEIGDVASKFGLKGTFVVGAVGFVVLYVLISFALEAWLEYNDTKMTGPLGSAMGQLLDKIFSIRFIRVPEWAGIAALLLFSGIAAWESTPRKPVSYQGQRNAGLFSQILAGLRTSHANDHERVYPDGSQTQAVPPAHRPRPAARAAA